MQINDLLEDKLTKHIDAEQDLFSSAHDVLTKIEKMCKKRLRDKNLTDQHKKQYKSLISHVETSIKVMKDHLDSYDC